MFLVRLYTSGYNGWVGSGAGPGLAGAFWQGSNGSVEALVVSQAAD